MRKYRLGYSIEEYQKKVNTGEWQAHTFQLGFLITEIKEYTEERVLIVHLVGGERFAEWKSQADARITALALKHRCNAIEAVCRLGLEKKLLPLGYKRHRVLVRKELCTD